MFFRGVLDFINTYIWTEWHSTAVRVASSHRMQFQELFKEIIVLISFLFFELTKIEGNQI
jgi:hypothetical protein